MEQSSGQFETDTAPALPTGIASLDGPIAADLKTVCRIFDDELFSDLPVVNELCAHVRTYRGKMLRPTLLLLSARACGRVTEEHYTLAAVVEMVHMATLVHDDVLDEADLRRRSPTIHRFKGNEAAVLLGDYLISHAYHLCSSIGSQAAARAIAATTNTVCEGELQQIHHRGDMGLSLEPYLQIVSRKTGALTGTACGLGAQFAGAEERVSAALERYGMDVGIAFQITDDVLDIVGSEKSMGKTLGLDLDKRKLTLPIIDCLGRLESGPREELRRLLAGRDIDRHELRKVLDRTESIARTMAVARQYIQRAVEALNPLKDSPARGELARMAQRILDRQQ